LVFRVSSKRNNEGARANAAVREELESGTLVRLVVHGWLSPPSTTGIVRLRGRTLSPAAKAVIAAIVRAAGEINV
jgi:DNA-binding transcriptional LysR family regulator